MKFGNPHRPEMTNLVLAVVISSIILILWQVFYEMPRQKVLVENMKREEALKKQQQTEVTPFVATDGTPDLARHRSQLLSESPRLKIRSDTLHGSLNLKGLRFDDLTLAKYRVELDKNSPEVILFSPSGYADVYFTEFGWVSSDPAIALPSKDTIWQADATEIIPEKPVTLTWQNPQGIRFEVMLTMDTQYLFTVEQRVTNRSGANIAIQPYAYINRFFPKDHAANYILHEGPIGVFGEQLQEKTYKTLREDQEITLTDGRWLGITDKYWQSVLIPAQGGVSAKFSYYQSKGQDRYQVDFITPVQQIANGETASTKTRLFAGAKELAVLEQYRKQFDIPLFDRSVDFGVLYFLTKPLFLMLNYFYSHIGNFGLALMLLTVVIKLLMYPLANKSYVAMSQMKRLQPEMMRLRDQYIDDKMRMNQEIMGLYRREKVNPAAGCLPILLQIPVFFALYKVLFVSIEMRHAPFYGWIKDLSAPDPTNLFTLFGLLEWNAPMFLHIGVLPILFCVTMIIQQKLNPPPADPMQAKILAWMPYIFLFLFAKFPAGLVLYWTWSNILSIIQQKIIMIRYNAKHEKKS